MLLFSNNIRRRKKMTIANIWPVANQHLYQEEDYAMILAHLVKKNLYSPSTFQDPAQHIIMDNGAFEGEQVSQNLSDLISLAENSGLPINEIVVPDEINNIARTYVLFHESLPAIRQWQNKYKFMVVAHATNFTELNLMIDYYNQFYGKLNLVVGISKLTPLDRADEQAIEAYKKCKFPIHFLGIKKTFKELDKVKEIIRSCDTSQLAYMAKNGWEMKESVWDFVRTEQGKDIDLEHDEINGGEARILRMREHLRMQRK